MCNIVGYLTYAPGSRGCITGPWCATGIEDYAEELKIVDSIHLCWSPAWDLVNVISFKDIDTAVASFRLSG